MVEKDNEFQEPSFEEGYSQEELDELADREEAYDGPSESDFQELDNDGSRSRDQSQESKSSEASKNRSLKERAGDSAKNIATNAAKNTAMQAPGVKETAETIEKIDEKVKQTRKLADDVRRGVQTISAGVAKGIALLGNPVFWIVTGVILLLTLVLITIISTSEVYGQQKSTGGSGASGEVLERLAQRAQWLQEHYTEYDGSQSLSSLGALPASNLSNNPWGSACPNIVAIIWGLSPYLINYNGNVNAYENWSDHPEMYQAYAFDSFYGNGDASTGAQLAYPPAGAIVSMDTGKPAGHTYVMLTDELIIDNYGLGGIGAGTGPRIMSLTNGGLRGTITGWALPNNEGFEGTFITGAFDGMPENAAPNFAMPDLPPVPTWAVQAGESTTLTVK